MVILKSEGYESEERLVRGIVACIKRARRREYRREFEVDAGVGVADLVLAKRSRRSTDGLTALSKISPRLADLLSRDVGSSIGTRESLAKYLGTSDGAASRVIAHLSMNGLIEREKQGFRVLTVKRLPFERLIAAEAKISDWQRVLVQAYRNLQFSNESWAVLDHAYIRSALANADRFKAAGVGLASVDKNRGLFIHVRAETHGPMSAGKAWQAQAVLASRIVGGG